MYIVGIEDKYPTQLLEKRGLLEGNVIACLWKNPELYIDYPDLASDDFVTEDGRFFFRLGQDMVRSGYKALDNLSITTYLADKKTAMEFYEEKGGYTGIKELVELVNIENMERYNDDLVKANILLKLHDHKFNVLDDLAKFEKMDSEQVYQFYDFHLNNIFLKKQVHVKPVDLTINYDAYLEAVNKGAKLGISIGSACPILNYHLAGIHTSNLLLHATLSGFGKTTSAIVFFILPMLEQGEKVVVIANEQGEEEWRSMLIPTIISNKLHHYGFNRQRMLYGKFSNEEWAVLKRATQWLKQYERNLVFVPLYDYSISNIKKIVGKYSKQGFRNFIYDTAKPSDETNERAWATFTEDSKQLFQIAHKADIRMICTVQLSGASSVTRYLTVANFAKSKAIKEVAGQVIMMRGVWDDEYDKEKYDIKPYNYAKDENGKYLNTKAHFTLDPTKNYAILFLDKNRFGRDKITLVYEKSADFNVWKELGYCTVTQNFGQQG